MGQLLKTKPGTNGYDLVVTGDINIVAEIKCNRPINNEFRFGSNQKDGIIKDIKGLLDGKSKGTSIELAVPFKFLGLYDFGDHTLFAMQYLIKKLPADLKDKVTIYEEGQILTKDRVYIVFIK